MQPNRLRPGLHLLAAATILVGLAQPGIARASDPSSDPAVVDPSAPMVAPEGSDLPSGFLDGEPVGNGTTDLPPSDSGASARTSAADTAAADPTPTRRYVGAGVWSAMRSAAANAPRPCAVSTDDVVAMMISPIFKESSAATTAATAGSPMTLSRADEWTGGVYSTTSNVAANYGLYENRDPNTPYQRAYWHPGIGIWQYDSAGVGAPFTAIERMDVNIVGADVANGMISRYCKSTATTSFDKRRAAWSPWLTACTTTDPSQNLCEIEFQAMVGGSSKFANISTVAGIDATGGALKRSCTVGGATVECWYIDPNRSQGATGWKFNVTGGPDWRTRPTPLSFPFYVIKRNGYEERHWLKADTGYAVDIQAKRLIGKNARPRSGTVNVGSGLEWTRSTTLCDKTANRGNCGTTTPPSTTTTTPSTTTTTKPPTTEPPADTHPSAPTGLRAMAQQVGSEYQPLVFDMNGDGNDDVLWYAPGAAADYLWIGSSTAGRFRSVPLPINGNYTLHRVDIDGDGKDDILFVPTSGDVVAFWRSRGDGTFSQGSAIRPSGAEPLMVRRDHARRHDILWYGAGANPDAWWTWNGSSFAQSAASISGTYRPFVGDFDGNGRDDIVWYKPGAGPTPMWLHKLAGGYLDLAFTVGNDFTPKVGDFDGDRKDDILWYQAGTVGESIWFGAPSGAFVRQNFVVTDTYVPVVTDLQGDGRSDVVWYNPQGGAGLWTRWTSGRARSSTTAAASVGYQPLGGSFGTNGNEGLFWYGPGAIADGLWYA